MSKIYKINHIINNNIKKVYVFIGDNEFNINKIFSKKEIKKIDAGEIKFKLIKKFIYDDDTILRIKEKIMKYTDINISTFEMYLFSIKKTILDPRIIYNRLTNNKRLGLTYEMLSIFLSNILSTSTNLNVDYTKYIKEKKSNYDYNDFVSLNINWDKEYHLTNMIGQKNIFLNNNYTSNPYNIKIFDDLIYNEGGNYISTQNKYLLFEYDNIVNNNIYLCDAENVIKYSNEKFNKEDYLLKLFFPLLYNSEKIKNENKLNKKKQQLLDKDEKRLKDRFDDYNEIIDYLYKINNKNKKNITKSKSGVKNIYFTFYQKNNIKLPLESIFKLINADKNIQLIKYNPGRQIENIYRLYTNGYYSVDGKKIPVLYVDSNNKKSKIIKISKELSTRKKVGYFLLYNNEEIYYEFLENGSIEVRINFKNIKNIDYIDNLISESLNNILLSKIKQYLAQSGYTYSLFNSLKDDSIKINSLDYVVNVNESKQINLNNIVRCLSTIFNINKGVMKKSEDEINLTYKRVSSFHKMNSIMTFITLSRKKNMNTDSIIENLQNNFQISEDEAKLHIVNWQTQVDVTLDKNENAKIDIESNPGFEVIIKSNIFNKNIDDAQGMIIQVNDINNINYLKFLDTYLNSLIILIYYNDILDKTKLNKICKGKLKEIKEIKEIKADKEDDLLGIKNDGKVTFETNNNDEDDALDAFFAVDSDMEDDEFDENVNINLDAIDQPDDNLDDKLNVEDDNEVNNAIDDADITFEKINFNKGEEESKDEMSLLQKSEEVNDDSENIDSVSFQEIDFDDELSEMEEGWDDDLVGGGSDDIEINLENLPLSGAKNIFMKRLRDREPTLFLKKENKNFQSYSQSCPWQFKKQPIILTKEEKEYIDKKDSEFKSKSYDEYITYGTGKEKYHYICPRYWCIRDKNNKGRSLTWKQINQGECGGWDALIPDGAKKVPKGKRIFEFTDKRMHKEGFKTNNPLVYKPMYPSFQSPNKHPDGLCVPCCFGSPRTFGYDGLWEKRKKGSKDIYVNKETGEEKDTPPIKELDTYKGKPEPTFDRDEKGNIIETTIKGVKHIRSQPAPDRLNMYNQCDESEKKGNVQEEKKQSKVIKTTLFNDTPLIESFPLKSGQLGYLPLSLQKFLNYNSENICKDERNNKLKEQVNCLMRIGIENNDNQSFLAAIANIYYSMLNNEHNTEKKIKKKVNLTISELKKIMIENITPTKFLSVQNGNLLNLFYNENKNINLDLYKSSEINNKINNDKFMEKLVNSYENFKDYLLNDTIQINYEYLWDFITDPISENGLLFEDGVNLIILNSPNNDITDKIELICPTNNNSINIFDIIKPTILLYSKNNFYEPLCQIKRNKKKYIIKKFFEFEKLNSTLPKLYDIMYKIKEKLLNECVSKRSLPLKYNKKYDFESNIPLKLLLNELEKLNYGNFKQVLNYNSQVVALICEKNNEQVYVPCLPSGLLNDIEYIFISDNIYVNDYENTKTILTNLYNESNSIIKSKPKIKVVSNKMLVGIITITNQFVPISPEVYNGDDDDLILLESNNYIWNDNDVLMNDNVDEERILTVKKIKLETNFYNMFRNTFKIIINENDKREEKEKLIDILKNSAIEYLTKLNLIKEILMDVLFKSVEFVDYDFSDISSYDDLILCLGLSENDCSERINCGSFLKENNVCKLLIPSKNILNSENLNSIIYYDKLADELIRYGRIREYIFAPKKFLSFEKMQYKLNKEEIILLEDILLNKYFENVIMDNPNEYIGLNDTYDTVNPKNHIAYREMFEIDDVNVKKIKFKKKKKEVIKTSIICDVENSKITFTGWINYNLSKENYNIKEYNNTGMCSFYLLKDIISNKLKRNVEIFEIKNKLINLILNEVNKGWETKKIIGKIFYSSGNKSLFKQVLVANWENLIMSEDYYLTEYEIYLLCREYKINLIGLASKGGNHLLPISNKNIFSTIHDDNELYIIILKGYNNKNKPYSYAVVMDLNNNLNLHINSENKNNLTKLKAYAGKMKSIDKFYSDFITMFTIKDKAKKNYHKNYIKKKREKKLGKVKLKKKT